MKFTLRTLKAFLDSKRMFRWKGNILVAEVDVCVAAHQQTSKMHRGGAGGEER